MALIKPAKVYEPPNQEQRSAERWGEGDTRNVGHPATGPPSGNEMNLSRCLSGFFVPRSHPSPGLMLSSIGHLLCSSQTDVSLSNPSPTTTTKKKNLRKTGKPERGSQDEVRLLTAFAPLPSWDKLHAEPRHPQFPSDLRPELEEVPSLGVTEASPGTTQLRPGPRVRLKLRRLDTPQERQHPPALTSSVFKYSGSMAPRGSWIWPNTSASPGSRLSTKITDTTDELLRALPRCLTPSQSLSIKHDSLRSWIFHALRFFRLLAFFGVCLHAHSASDHRVILTPRDGHQEGTQLAPRVWRVRR